MGYSKPTLADSDSNRAHAHQPRPRHADPPHRPQPAQLHRPLHPSRRTLAHSSEFHSTDQQMGALTTALFLVYMLTAPLTGWLGDRFRASRSSLPARCCGAATLATAWVHATGLSTFATRWSASARPHSASSPLPCWPTSIPSAIATGSSPSSTSPSPSARLSATWPAADGPALGVARAVLHLRHSRPCRRRALLVLRARAQCAAHSDHLKATPDRATFAGLFRNPAFLTATFGLAALTFAMGGISTWVPEFLRPHRPLC